MPQDAFGNYVCTSDDSASPSVPATGGGGGSAADYGGLTPTISGASGMSTVDTSTGRVWWYYGGQWN